VPLRRDIAVGGALNAGLARHGDAAISAWF